MQKRIVCENLRSAYNVGNIIRTADSLGRKVILVWYTAPKEHKKVSKTALGAEDNVDLQHFQTLEEFYEWIKDNQIILISAEKTNESVRLDDVELGGPSSPFDSATLRSGSSGWQQLAVVMGNEVTWVEQSTLDASGYIIHIPMIWTKESFNVWQAAAIMMRELNQVLNEKMLNAE